MTAAPNVAPSAVHWMRVIVGVLAAAVIFGGLALWHPPGLYLWIKAVHVMAVISWMAGMLYLPRLFVYHCQAEVGTKQSETFKVMERRLLRGIINPSMVVTWGLGLWLAYDSALWADHWLQLKVVFVAILSGIHGMLVRWTRDFATDQNRHTQRFYRIINEIPALLMVGIVILVVVKPF